MLLPTKQLKTKQTNNNSQPTQHTSEHPNSKQIVIKTTNTNNYQAKQQTKRQTASKS